METGRRYRFPYDRSWASVGCTVSIVKEDAVKSFIENVGKIYEEKIGYKADFYVVEIGDGAGIWE